MSEEQLRWLAAESAAEIEQGSMAIALLKFVFRGNSLIEDYWTDPSIGLACDALSISRIQAARWACYGFEGQLSWVRTL